ncbi:hypothetical protein L202_03055 [Cryptococcus amylolentus CBS 6039]|uniref:TPR domain-containing protein n=2 Tax=Cryptococcus amylolentus TaxID=104669 RepID=A0A1E3HXR6_9TREE|nr:hypothetical protein L202_03055 [Cryptococcus amylolentus CBS 6039]ODN80935.1 hypothetical protein L202_03055 [Cryptococcus amylolentus CBS 6039]ODO09424.1 hypothetical protein I350_03024 [Cryptococcus amylolentus CBS 6273]
MPRINPSALLRTANGYSSSLPRRALARPPLSSTPALMTRRLQSTTTGPATGNAQQKASTEPPKEEQAPKDDEEKLPWWKRGLKVNWMFTTLAGFGALVTIYGVLEFYSTLTRWPQPVRKPLRAALKAKMRGDYGKAEQYFREALEVALELGPAALEPDPLLKISGIYAELAAVLELRLQRISAFVELRTALELFGSDPLRLPTSVASPTEAAALGGGPGGEWISPTYALTEKDHVRAIGLYQKLGQLALEVASSPKAPTYESTIVEGINVSPHQVFKDWDDAAEYYLSSALNTMLKIGLQPPASPASAPSPENPVILGRDINLPSAAPSENPEDPEQGGQVDKRGLCMTMESLSEVHSRKGEYNVAGQLLLQAVSVLMPAGEEEPPLRDRCQAAMLMTTISSHALHPPSSKALKVSRSWSLRALQVAQQSLASEGEKGSLNDSPLEAAAAVCERARAVGLHNLGMIAEMEKDYPGAQNLFNKALSVARETGFSEGKRESLAALRRVQKLAEAAVNAK